MTISSEVRAELDQSPAWWDREYRALVRKTHPRKPFAPEDHEGHDLVMFGTYGSTTVTTVCTQCGDDD